MDAANGEGRRGRGGGGAGREVGRDGGGGDSGWGGQEGVGGGEDLVWFVVPKRAVCLLDLLLG